TRLAPALTKTPSWMAVRIALVTSARARMSVRPTCPIHWAPGALLVCLLALSRRSSGRGRRGRGLRAGRARHGLDRDGAHRRPVIEVDVLHRVVHVVIAGAVDIVILHEEHDRYASVGEYLSVRVVQRAPRVRGHAYVAGQLKERRHLRDRGTVRTAAA